MKWRVFAIECDIVKLLRLAVICHSELPVLSPVEGSKGVVEGGRGISACDGKIGLAPL
jgi:hypothetical protein